MPLKRLWNGGEQTIAGSLLGREAPRLVRIDNFRIDARLEGITLVIESIDVPGVISRVSTLLATNGLNIAEWRLGRIAPGAEARAFVNLDSPASANVLKEVTQLKGVKRMRQIYL